MSRYVFAIIVLVVLPFTLGAATVNSMPNTAPDSRVQACADQVGVSGKHLPSLLKEAIKVTPAFLDSGVRLTADQVVYLPDMSKFKACMKEQGLDVSEAAKLRAFSLGLKFPVFVNGDNPDTPTAIKYYDEGATYIKYEFARYLGHEQAHLMYRTLSEAEPLAYELSLVNLFLKKGQLPAECVADVRALERAIAAEKRQTVASVVFTR